MSPNTPNMMPNPSNNFYSNKPCNNNKDDLNHHRGKGLSFLALVFFTFFYVCIFKVFNISPLDVVSNGRFIFFLSNTLVMILAADFGAFTSSSSKVVNVYKSDAKVPAPCNELIKLPLAAYAEADDTKELIVVEENLPNEVEQVVDAPPVPARGEEVKLLTYHDVGTCDSCGDIRADDDEEELEEMAEEGERVAEKRDEEDEDESSQKSSEELNKRAEAEEDEFSRMSDEELNKRVEEFIWRLKTQIRLQAARDTE